MSREVSSATKDAIQDFEKLGANCEEVSLQPFLILLQHTTQSHPQRLAVILQDMIISDTVMILTQKAMNTIHTFLNQEPNLVLKLHVE